MRPMPRTSRIPNDSDEADRRTPVTRRAAMVGRQTASGVSAPPPSIDVDQPIVSARVTIVEFTWPSRLGVQVVLLVDRTYLH
jgi:hypothetical protein